ncbi:helix-turn-helix domain-containing protein [Amycolatopsis sp. WQ 127309]|uniref:winged helix-turn-helix domain-containing protein n=1 Tax=Amycolatopsis sp. WQ 127309 TaxID=2932773 RepID=UPI001FF31326|nr:helix-turn-helix domain-containing protein [Amycolatopsis sp. WQ 127309]UOZ06988.1 helix-turn-helix domain-containing protein [Amycolatopsis sp. WQ 127309]
MLRLADPVVTLGDVVLDIETGAGNHDGRPVRLSAAELVMLRMLLWHRGDMVSWRVLANELESTGVMYSRDRVRWRIAVLRKKLDDQAGHVIQTVQWKGYRLG